MSSAATDHAAHNMWKQLNQLVMSLLLSSLTEEDLCITIGFTTSKDVWNSLETTFNQKSKARELQIKYELHLKRHGSRSISEYSRIFKAYCDQLSAMGHPVEDTDKVHWYLRGLGHEFSTFSITQLSLTHIPSFKDIVPKAKSFDSINHNTREGHYATDCYRKYIKPDANLAEALAYCTIKDEPADWYTDTGASAHMTADASQLDKVEPYTGKDKVIVGNGSSLPITYTGSCSPTPNLQLNDVLVVSNLTKILLSVNKLTHDYPLFVSFTDNDFIIHNLQTQKVAASGKHVDGLYVEAFSTTIFTINSLPTPVLNGTSPFEILHDYIVFHDPISSPPIMASTNSSTGHSSPSSVTSSMPCKTWALDLPSSQSTSSLEPKGFKSAAKSLEWLVVMDEEIRALKLNQTWELVPRPSTMNVVGSKWVFHTKYHLDGSIDRLKACLVAKGYTQLYGLDFNDTFSPVVRASTISIVLSIAVSHG
ncbi:uncharacterized protein [Populus alba]|uniref:uncharacterized protein n=1 Tax=Populus alba TaxID=43335 RepID=UPI003CC71EBB